MTQPSPGSDSFPSSEFDQWAAQYDEDVTGEGFPFTGYRRVLAETARLAGARAGMAVLDLGAGTGNLSRLFISQGCQVWGTDFSSEMIERARAKITQARFFLHDLRQVFPPEFARRFDRVVSAYVFHHFELADKLLIVGRIMDGLLAPGGRLVMADISFPDQQALDAARQAAGEAWDDEPYWVAAEALPALRLIYPGAAYTQVADCAGIYRLDKTPSRPAPDGPLE